MLGLRPKSNRMLDTKPKSADNLGRYIVIEGDGQQLKIDKRDMMWSKVGGHKHHYLPDFTDETEVYVALTCALRSCNHGMLHKKEGKPFMDWLEEHRAKA